MSERKAPTVQESLDRLIKQNEELTDRAQTLFAKIHNLYEQDQIDFGKIYYAK